MADAHLTVTGFKPQDLITVSNSEPCTTSLKIAEVFGKRHDNLIAKLKTLDCSNDFRALHFKVCHKNNELQNGKPLPFYEMTKDGFMFLVMGFTGKKAAAIKEAYINAFNWMADQLSKQNVQSAPKQRHLLGSPLLNEAVVSEINRSARMLSGRTYNRYRNRLLQEALKEFPEDPMEVAQLAEQIWCNEQQREEIDGIPVANLKHAYNLCLVFLSGQSGELSSLARDSHMACWLADMEEFSTEVRAK